MTELLEPLDPDWKPYWRELVGQPRGLKAGEVCSGFWEARTREGGRTPLATWRDEDGDMVYLLGDRGLLIADAEFAEKTFSRAKAVLEHVHRAAHATGKWPDQVEMPAAAAPTSDGVERRNTPPSDDVLIADQLRELLRDQATWLKSIGGKVTTQEHADKASGFKEKFAALRAKAELGKKTVKAPVLVEADRLEKLWKPVINGCADAQRAAADLSTEFLKAETARKAAEAAAKAAEGNPVPAGKSTRASAGTGKGATRLVTTKKLVVDDYDKVFEHFAALQPFRTDDEIKRLVWRRADGALRNGVDVPGARLVEETSSR